MRRSIIGVNKIIVIGCPGSGKSTFSRALHATTGILLSHRKLFVKIEKGE